MSSSPPIRAQSSLTRRIPTAVIYAGVFTVSLALVFYAYLGSFSRYYADDFCLTGMFFQQGFWKAQVLSYTTWSNRYAGMFLIGLSELPGHFFIRFWTGLTILLWVTALTWLIHQISHLVQLPFSRLAALLLAEFAVFVTIVAAPQLYQVLFWRIGLLTYTLPLSFLVILIVLLIQFARSTPAAKIPWGGSAACLLIAFFAGGFSETYVALQTTLLVIILVFILLAVRKGSKRNWSILMVASLGGSLLAMLVVILAPGNSLRQAILPRQEGLIPLIKITLESTFIFIIVKYLPYVILASLVPLLLTYSYLAANRLKVSFSPAKLLLWILATPVVAFILIAATMAPAAFATSTYPDGRVLVEPTFIFFSSLIVEGILTGIIFSQVHRWAGEEIPVHLPIMTALVLFLLLLYPLYDAHKSYDRIPAFRSLAVSWDLRDTRIRTARGAGIFDVQEKGLNPPGELSEMVPEASNWVNRCVASFYDLQTITAGTR
jgi:hypothetical protein